MIRMGAFFSIFGLEETTKPPTTKTPTTKTPTTKPPTTKPPDSSGCLVESEDGAIYYKCNK